MRYDFKLLKETRQRKLMTRTELAKRAGVSYGTVSKVEAGKAPWIKAIREIAEVLGVKDRVMQPLDRKRSA